MVVSGAQAQQGEMKHDKDTTTSKGIVFFEKPPFYNTKQLGFLQVKLASRLELGGELIYWFRCRVMFVSNSKTKMRVDV